MSMEPPLPLGRVDNLNELAGASETQPAAAIRYIGMLESMKINNGALARPLA